jgi:hypothetical protein
MLRSPSAGSRAVEDYSVVNGPSPRLRTSFLQRAVDVLLEGGDLVHHLLRFDLDGFPAAVQVVLDQPGGRRPALHRGEVGGDVVELVADLPILGGGLHDVELPVLGLEVADGTEDHLEAFRQPVVVLGGVVEQPTHPRLQGVGSAPALVEHLLGLRVVRVVHH